MRGVAVGVAHDERGEFVDEFAPSRRRERADAPDVVQLAVRVGEREQQRSDAIAALVHAITDDDGFGRALVLDLEHRALARLVDVGATLRDDAVEPRALELLEPATCLLGVARRTRQVDRIDRRPLREQRLQSCATFLERLAHDVVVALGEQVERDELRRCLGGQLLDARRGGVDACAEGVPTEPLMPGRALSQHDLTVEDDTFGQRRLQRLDEFREVARQQLRAARVQVDIVAVPRDDAAETVPLRFVGELVTLRHARDGLREHRLDGQCDGQAHATHCRPIRVAAARASTPRRSEMRRRS